MTDRMAKMSRMLALVHLLADSAEGLTLDEMAAALGVNRRTAERMGDVIAVSFDLDERHDDRVKRFRITGSVRRVYTRPTAAERQPCLTKPGMAGHDAEVAVIQKAMVAA